MAETKSGLNEDRVALLIGGIIFVLAFAKLIGSDGLGWVVKVGMWVHSPMDAWKSAASGLMAGWQAVLCTIAFMTVMLSIGVKLMKGNVAAFIPRFILVFVIAFICYTLGANAYMAASLPSRAFRGLLV